MYNMEVDDELWRMEFYLKTPIENTAIKRARTTADGTERVNYFRKIVFLKALQDWISRDSIEECLLKTMVLLEEIFRVEGSTGNAALRDAFCAVAVECTIKHLHGNVSRSSYLDAVKMIWWKIVRPLKPSFYRQEKQNLLFSDELEKWNRDIVASVNDMRVRERLASNQNTKEVAVDKVKVFLTESWESLDLSFLVMAVEDDDAVAEAAKEKQQKETQEDIDDGKCTYEEMDPLTTCQSNVPPTTMNAHAHEGETSTRIQLPSPKRKRVSPLKNHEPPNVIRRKSRRWSPLEVETLEKAVNEFGRQWKKILNAHKDVFENRTDVDLKDKWRNMERYGFK